MPQISLEPAIEHAGASPDHVPLDAPKEVAIDRWEVRPGLDGEGKRPVHPRVQVQQIGPGELSLEHPLEAVQQPQDRGLELRVRLHRLRRAGRAAVGWPGPEVALVDGRRQTPSPRHASQGPKALAEEWLDQGRAVRCHPGRQLSRRGDPDHRTEGQHRLDHDRIVERPPAVQQLLSGGEPSGGWHEEARPGRPFGHHTLVDQVLHRGAEGEERRVAGGQDGEVVVRRELGLHGGLVVRICDEWDGHGAAAVARGRGDRQWGRDRHRRAVARSSQASNRRQGRTGLTVPAVGDEHPVPRDHAITLATNPTAIGAPGPRRRSPGDAG